MTTIYVRTRQKCPECGSKFVDQGNIMICPTCLEKKKQVIFPTSYYLDFNLQGKKVCIYGTKAQEPLKYYEQAIAEAQKVNQEIKSKSFDVVDYRVRILYFKDVAGAWLEGQRKRYEKKAISRGTLDKIEFYMEKYFIPGFGGKTIKTIDSKAIEDFYYSLPSELAPKYLKNIFTFLKMIFISAAENNIILEVPDFPKITEQERKPKWLGREEQNKIFAHIPEEHRPIFLFLMRQGVRPSEARALHWEDLDFKKKIVCIHRNFSGDDHGELQEKTKGKKEIWLPLFSDVAESLSRLEKRSPLVFLNNEGKPYYRHRLNYLWNNAVSKAGLPYIRLYEGTRHSVASQMREKGVPLDIISEWLGHSKIDQSRIYSHIDLTTLEKIVEKLEDTK